jgi:hypothetical protein
MEGIKETNNKPKEAYGKDIFLESPEGILNEARSQFFPIYVLLNDNFDQIKNLIKSMNLKSFEDYTLDKHKDNGSQIIKEVEKTNPDVFIKYNEIIEKLKDPDLSEDEFFEAIEHSYDLKIYKYEN